MPDCLGHGRTWSLSLLQGLELFWQGHTCGVLLFTEQDLQCQCVLPKVPMPAWLLCAEQHWLGAPWGHGVRPVPAVPGERLGHQLQVPRLQVFEGCTEVRQGGVLGWVTAVTASTVTEHSHGRVWAWELQIQSCPRAKVMVQYPSLLFQRMEICCS